MKFNLLSIKTVVPQTVERGLRTRFSDAHILKRVRRPRSTPGDCIVTAEVAADRGQAGGLTVPPATNLGKIKFGSGAR